MFLLTRASGCADRIALFSPTVARVIGADISGVTSHSIPHTRHVNPYQRHRDGAVVEGCTDAFTIPKGNMYNSHHAENGMSGIVTSHGVSK
ncbi:hypothetical protein BH09GEM1_BH09GEM1_11700 [soil metagenome]